MRPPCDSPRSSTGSVEAPSLVKARLRREAREARGALPVEQRAAWSAVIRERFLDLDEWRKARVIGMYAPLRCEVDILPLGEEALARGKQVAFPRANPPRATLWFYRVASLGDLSPGTHGILEPPDVAARRTTLEEMDLLLVPGLAFDFKGQRLGFGGGYYDRLLSERGRGGGPYSIGVAFECQVLSALPVASHDRPVDALVTEVMIRVAKSRPGRNR
jgi:5-formyltetrahydrofolate cyclo-ligase